MKKTNIYPNRSQELLALFERAGSHSKLMCVPIDYAKEDHLVMFCNGNGEVLSLCIKQSQASIIIHKSACYLNFFTEKFANLALCLVMY